MKAEDIIWGGNNKGVIRLKNDIGLEPGTLVNIEYDYIKEVYYLNRDVERVDISAAENVIEMLNNIYLTGTAPTTMVFFRIFWSVYRTKKKLKGLSKSTQMLLPQHVSNLWG